MSCEYAQRYPDNGPCEPGDCGINTCPHREEELRYERREIRNRYLELLPYIRAVARAVGYAITVHGSLTRDMDLVAIPWTHEAVSAEKLIEAVADGVRTGNKGLVAMKEGNPTSKPHGRRVWVLHLGGHPYIDLSVMPLSRNDGIW